MKIQRIALMSLIVSLSLPLQAQTHGNPLLTATVSGVSVRYAGFGEVWALRLAVFDVEGQLVFDSSSVRGNLFDYALADRDGKRLSDGSYLFVVTITDLDDVPSRKFGMLRIADGSVLLENATTDGLSPRQLQALEINAGMPVMSPIDRIGVAMPGEPQAPDASEADGNGSGKSAASKRFKPRTDALGTGTPNKIAKWVDVGGVLGDSVMAEFNGRIGIGTTAPGGQLHIFGGPLADVFAGMGPDVVSGPAMNYGYSGATFGRGSGFFNVRPDAHPQTIAPNPSLRFMTVNVQRMIITNVGNVGIGTTSPAQKLDVVGNVGIPLTTAASLGVITLGGNRFVHAFGTNNTFLGVNAGNFTMTGENNTAGGSEALLNNTDGYENTATGSKALMSNSSGSYNTASGSYALFYNTAGYNNTAIGHRALYANTGNGNVAIGAYAGGDIAAGENNIHIGDAGLAADTNYIRIGTSQDKTFIAGIRGKTTDSSDTLPVLIDLNGQLGTASSSRRSKFDIVGMGESTENLMRLRPVTFRYLAHGNKAPVQYGLIAEEVAEVYPELVARNRDGEVETVMYQFLPPMLLNEVQKQSRRDEDQQKTIDRLEQRLQALEKQIANGRQ